jgi:Domain of unknown function (DUF4157)
MSQWTQAMMYRQQQNVITQPFTGGTLQRKCACGQHTIAGGECEECHQKEGMVQRSAVSATPVNTVPPIVHEVLSSCGQSLDAGTRAIMEPHFGHDFSQVQVHADTRAAESARAVNALAYTVGRDVVFGEGRYEPETSEGKRLLAHELTHVVQQSRGGSGLEAESHAETAAGRITRGQSVASEMIGGASPGLYAQKEDETKTRKPTETSPIFNLSWDTLAQLGGFQLRPPFLPPAERSSSAEGPAEAPELPSRLPLVSSGRFSLGLRLGFPETEVKEFPGAPESALSASLRQAKVMEQQLTGKIPTSWEALDKAKLASAIWGIFSTQIAPDVARGITSGLTKSTKTGGTSFTLDLVILTDFSGGGLSFTIQH